MWRVHRKLKGYHVYSDVYYAYLLKVHTLIYPERRLLALWWLLVPILLLALLIKSIYFAPLAVQPLTEQGASAPAPPVVPKVLAPTNVTLLPSYGALIPLYSPNNSPGLTQRTSVLWLSTPYLRAYQQWLHAKPVRLKKEAQYQRVLEKNKVTDVLLMPMLLSSQRDSKACKIDQWVIPPQELQANIVPTLKIIAQLQKQALILPSDLVSSVYREPKQNQCAHGVSKSKHLENRAVDIELKGKDAAQRYKKLCQFWRKNGSKLKMGLGTYTNHKIHIDAAAFRTWGSDYTRASSQCF